MVRTYRHEAGLTQRELAARAGLSVAALRDFEQSRRHRPRPNSLDALVGALDLDPDQAASLARAAALPRQRPGAMPSPRPPQPDSGFAQTAHSSGRGAGLWLSALGPLEAWGDGTPLSLGPPARRAVLGLLLMDPGVLVRRDTIVDVLWGESPPRTAVGLVQAHVSRTRRLLNSHNRFGDNEGVIDSVRTAYRLSLSCKEVDLLLFRELAARAAAAWAGGDDVAATECYGYAVGLWRGEPLADVEALSGHPGITALKQELAGVLMRYAEAACALGQHDRVLPRLQALADAEPLNEPTHARLMIALAGSGQQAAAIGVYEDMRSRLDRELGLYPGEELAEAYARVLRQDIRAGNRGRAPARPPALPATVHVVPRQLPAAPRCFTGHRDELAMLSTLVERDLRETSGVVIAALTGMAGIGKTALAVHWAHQVADQFPDGQLFVNLRGSGPSGTPVMPTDAVRGFLTALGVPPARIPPDTDGQAALYRSLLADRRMLIALDNARDAEQVRLLLPGSPGCLVLVTSRNRLTGLVAAEGARLITPGVLTEAESHGLLALHLGAGRVKAEDGAVSELIALCAGLPLALCDVAARAVARPCLSLAALAAEMRDARRRLDALETGESATSARMVFSWSRAKLGDRASRMFRLLGIHPGPDITGSAAASLTGLPRDQAYLALAELCDEHLLTEYVPGRYICHDLLRSYAVEEAMTRESEADRHAAVHRVLDHYLHVASVASGFLCPYYTEVTRTRPQPGVMLEEIGGPAQAAEWFENEQHVLLAMIGQAAEGGYAPHAWELPWVAGWYFQGKACWQRLAAAQESALAVAARLGDLTGLATAHQHLGWLRSLLGDIASAGHHLDESIKLSGQLSDGRLRALADLSHAYVLQAQDCIPEAMVQARQALRQIDTRFRPTSDDRQLNTPDDRGRLLLSEPQHPALRGEFGAFMGVGMIEQVLPAQVAAAESFGDDPAAKLFPEESLVMARATESRRREFATARACARAAMARLGWPAVAVLPGPRGAPQWPEGLTGSITHCAGYRAAAVGLTRDVVSLGVDAEPNEALPNHGMLELIALEGERVRLGELAAQMPGICWDRLLFSAKESVYKTWFPLARSWLGFESADIVIDPHAGTFTVRLLIPGPLVNGSPLTQLSGRWLAGQGLLVTAIVIPA